MKSCSPRQNFAVPVYKHEYGPHFCQPKKVDFYNSALLWWYCISYFIVVLTSRMLSNIYEPKWSWAEMVIGQNGNGPK